MKGEEARLQERLLDAACSCTWDANPAEGGPDDIIVKPDPECLAHGVLSALQSQRQLTEKAEARVETRIEMCEHEEALRQAAERQVSEYREALERARGKLDDAVRLELRAPSRSDFLDYGVADYVALVDQARALLTNQETKSR